MKKIATLYSGFSEKFGIPRQSGIIDNPCRIVFEPEFCREEAFRGLESYSHIWILWEFSENHNREWSATVRPPRLGGNKRVGVFATRSPFRPNPIGLSCVRLIDITKENGLITLLCEGADILDGTPIYDIKPYVPHCDVKLDAKGGFSDEVKDYKLTVTFSEQVFDNIEVAIKEHIIKIIEHDPRPSYQHDEERIYGFSYSGYEVKFIVDSLLQAKILSITKNMP